MNVNMLRSLLKFTAIVEIGTGLALMIDPRFVVGLLVGPNLPAEEHSDGSPAGHRDPRAWPGVLAERGSCRRVAPRRFRGMLVYSVLIALFLVYLFKVGHLGGVLLWPAVVLHAAVALLLIWSWRSARGAGARMIKAFRGIAGILGVMLSRPCRHRKCADELSR